MKIQDLHTFIRNLTNFKKNNFTFLSCNADTFAFHFIALNVTKLPPKKARYLNAVLLYQFLAFKFE